MPRLVVNPGLRIETLPSHSGPLVLLVSIHTPHWRPTPDLDHPCDEDAIPTEPRPRLSLQIYYTPLLTHPTELITVAHTLETAVLKPNDRFNTTSGAPYERLDVYSLPPVTTKAEEGARAVRGGLFAPTPTLADVADADTSDANEEAVKDGFFASLADADASVQRCVAHQLAEIAARDGENNADVKGKEWYIQRYGVPKGKWRRWIIVIHTPVAEWAWGSKEKTGRGLVLSTVVFNSIEDGLEHGQALVGSGSTDGEIREMIHEMRSELDWQWSYVQLLD